MNLSNASQPQRERVFVYGTLKRGQGNHHHLTNQKGLFVGEGVTASRFPLVVTRLPYLIKKPGVGHRITGELYDVTPRGLRILDRLEGHPVWYKREKITVLHDGHASQAWAYFTQNDDLIRNFRMLPLASNFQLHMLQHSFD